MAVVASETSFFSNEESDSVYVPYSQRPETYIVPVVFLLILIVGVVGNGMVVFILLRHADMRNTPNTYVLSLAIGDLLVIVTSVPFTWILYVAETWPWGLVVCKLSEFSKDISIGVSVFTVTALSGERYCGIADPIRRHIVMPDAKPVTILIAILIWIVAIIVALPAALFTHLQTIVIPNNLTISVCTSFPEEFGDSYKKGIVLGKFLIYYLLPLCVIAGFYVAMAFRLKLSTKNMPGELPITHRMKQIRARRKNISELISNCKTVLIVATILFFANLCVYFVATTVGKMVIVFAVLFFFCCLPYNVFMLWFHFYPSSRDDYDDYWHAFRIIGFCLIFINSCVNPIALYFVSGIFHKRFNEHLFCRPLTRAQSLDRSGRRTVSFSMTSHR